MSLREPRSTRTLTQEPDSAPIASRDEAVRVWWARYIGSQVLKDGTVPGFDVFHGGMTEDARKIAWWAAESCWPKIRAGRTADEVIDSGVRWARDQIMNGPDASILERAERFLRPSPVWTDAAHRSERPDYTDDCERTERFKTVAPKSFSSLADALGKGGTRYNEGHQIWNVPTR